MGNKSKIKVLFNRNHISITKEINVKNDESYVSFETNCMPYTTKSYRTEKKTTCKSPLGFYYTKTQYVRNNPIQNTIRVCKVFLPNETYTISYIIKQGDNSISVDARPWEICQGDKSIPTHMIIALKREIDKILGIIYENKLKIKINTYLKEEKIDFKLLNHHLYFDLFGNENGIRFQTDEEKIISHGFDIKTSFRK